jgi:hypothetical protein
MSDAIQTIVFYTLADGTKGSIAYSTPHVSVALRNAKRELRSDPDAAERNATITGYSHA